MIEEKNITPVGKFQKTHGLKGELNAVLDIDFEFFAEGYPLILNVEGAFVPFYAESVRGKGATTSLIKLKDIDSQDEARIFVNEVIYAEKENLKEFMGEAGEDLLLEDDLEGYRVVDENLGEIGVISRVDTTTENILFIVAIDEDRREVVTTLPEELVNLNQKRDGQ